MAEHIFDIRKINYLMNEIDALYHQASLKLGVSDSVSLVLYIIHTEGGTCLLSDIYKQTGISRQTVNSAVRGLEKDGVLFLEQSTGRSKRVVLTDKGKSFVDNTVERLCQAERRAFAAWSEEEERICIALLEKYKDCFGAEVEKL
ncbi:MAG: MarR family transcriptional regulator [Oscillospiraceae bacterium]|nr:MarR family transcriptional regulator [Oscillospiraceae bacterium]